MRTYEFAPIDAPQHLSIIDNKCMICKEQNQIFIFEKDYKAWMDGALIQDAFPYLSLQQREVLKTGIHPECWDKLYPPEDEF